jgi:hypothetical protein
MRIEAHMSRKANLVNALARCETARILPYPFVFADPRSWHESASALFDRNVLGSEDVADVVEDIGIDLQTADFWATQLRESANQLTRRSLILSTMSGRLAPPTLEQDSARKRAARIGAAVYKVVLGDPRLARYVIGTYARALSTDKQVVLTCLKHAVFAKALIKFVRSLTIPELDIRLIAFRCAQGQETNTVEWLSPLGLPEKGNLIRGQVARNKNATSTASHIGIEVVRQTKNGLVKQDGAFSHVMLLGAVVEIWRLGISVPAKKQMPAEIPSSIIAQLGGLKANQSGENRTDTSFSIQGRPRRGVFIRKSPSFTGFELRRVKPWSNTSSAEKVMPFQ